MHFIPLELLHFLYVVALSFLVGLELKAYRLMHTSDKPHLGSTRTFTFIGIMGYIFFKINLYYFLLGFLALVAIYLSYYFYKLHHDRTAIISFLLIALVYSFGAMMEEFSIWMPTLVYVLIVFILNANRSLSYILEQLNMHEFEILGKFLLLSAVILPILPDAPLPYLAISPFKIWLVIVIISAISYGSYIAQKYIFKNRGYLITGILGGLYSSTATTVVLAKKSLYIENIRLIDASIIIATAMMYIRLLVITFIFNFHVAIKIAFPLISLSLIGIIIALALFKKEENNPIAPIDDRNPLELGTAFLFGLLFVATMALTKFVTAHYGDFGLKILAFLIGFTDIDPFILSLLTGKFSISIEQIATAILIASGSNNILKAIYAILFGANKPKIAALWLVLLGLATIFLPFIIYKG
ncbi:hypothetical protein NitYY0826_C1148 [Nitratiruptor sp. YY08-26]|uniref:MgtC/SapB family protein n=1 Tax=unclassified Nitratiruptor TaxID=2624044 RepID=UPI001914F75C|nr:MULTISPECIES: DUF4010 domain-containing protein [unclassified Nitratiruptor]BCD62272.1 hypothetical protein NitYY0813_C1146 [Nitratiruptor sp. YY08-13]BCD66208.1 hypothetical protein NitYY0826_C1148 [Nitratiruptor sp. YY08-26]